MCVDQSVCVTSLRVCVVRGWRGNNILCVTDQSEIHTDYISQINTPEDNRQTPAESQTDTPSLMMTPDCDEAEPEEDVIHSGVRTKQSKVISYQVRNRTC